MISKKQNIRARNHLIENLRRTWVEITPTSFYKDGWYLYLEDIEWELYFVEYSVRPLIWKGVYEGNMMKQIKDCMENKI